jgi:hypothetical protein
MSDHQLSRPPRVRIDLRRVLSRGAQWALALAVVAGVAALAWGLHRDDPVPHWIGAYLVPALGWLYILVAIFSAIAWWRRRRAHRS